MTPNRINTQFRVAAFVVSLVTLFWMGNAAAATDEEQRIIHANTVLTKLVQIPEKGIPARLLQNAEAIMVIPDVLKVGLIIGGQHGKGLTMLRRDDGSWSNPIFVKLSGGSIGLQVGAQTNDVVLVFKSRRGVESLVEGNFKLGVDAAVAAGPVGRQASAATDFRFAAEVYSYSRSRGLFAGISLDGVSLRYDAEANDRFYQQPNIGLPAIFNDSRLPPPPALSLLTNIEFYAPTANPNISARRSNGTNIRRVSP